MDDETPEQEPLDAELPLPVPDDLVRPSRRKSRPRPPEDSAAPVEVDVAEPILKQRPQVSAAAVSAGSSSEILARALDSSRFRDLDGLRRHLGGATVHHALTWLGLRTGLFDVTD